MRINLKAENLISPSRTLGESYTTPATSYLMTDEERAEVIAKYGPPKMPLHQNKSHYLSGKKGAKKNDAQVPGSKNSSGRDRVSKQKRSKSLQGTDAS